MNRVTYNTGAEEMTCPQCDGWTKVIDSRGVRGKKRVRRRHICTGCGFRFSTLQMYVDEVDALEKAVSAATKMRADCIDFLDSTERYVR